MIKLASQYCIALLLLSSCAKEYSFENGQKAKGTLKADAGNNCLPQKVAGTYIISQQLSDSNYLEITVHFTRSGRFQIATDTVNGYYFFSSGSIKDTGFATLKLPGFGQPATVGINTFQIRFDSSLCTLPITVMPIAGTTPAVFSFNGAPNTCMNYSLHGLFAKGYAVSDSNNVTVEVNVSSSGFYAISTDTVNGYYFAASGMLNNTGIQNIHLKAYGTPLQSAIDVFTVRAPSSSCTFKDTVLTAITTANPDHFPLTYQSFWTYDNLLGTDTLWRQITDSTFTNSRWFKTMTETNRVGTVTKFMYNKTDTNYYEFGSIDKYTTSLSFSPKIEGNINFLKEYLRTGDVWYSDEYIGYIGIAPNNQKIYLQYKITCLDANAIVNINGTTYANVYKILINPRIHSDGLGYNAYASTGEYIYTYYAKGVGIVYAKTVINSFTFFERQIRNWSVH